MSDYKYTDLICELKEYTLWITLNRPENSNAFSDEMIDGLVNCLERADFDNKVRTIVLTGAGKHFCAGGDVKAMQTKTGMFAGEPNELRERYKKGIQKIPLAIEKLSTPIIAMINGAAIGAGLDLACMCDIRVCSEHAKFGETFAKLGLVPGDGGTYFLQRVIGFAKAMELSLTGDIIGSDEAQSLGLVSKVIAADLLKEHVEKLCLKINSNAPIAIQMLKRSMIHSYRSDLSSMLDLLNAYQGITQRTMDHDRAVAQIFNKSQTTFEHK